MQVYEVLLTVFMMLMFYICGLMTANWYNDKARREERHALEVQYRRLKADTDFDDPIGPYVGPDPRIHEVSECFDSNLAQQFEERLNNNGSATVMLKPNPTTKTNKRKGE